MLGALGGLFTFVDAFEAFEKAGLFGPVLGGAQGLISTDEDVVNGLEVQVTPTGECCANEGEVTGGEEVEVLFLGTDVGGL